MPSTKINSKYVKRVKCRSNIVKLILEKYMGEYLFYGVRDAFKHQLIVPIPSTSWC